MAKAVDKHNVEFEGKTMKLSPLTERFRQGWGVLTRLVPIKVRSIGDMVERG